MDSKTRDSLKSDFEKRVKRFVLDIIRLVDALPKDTSSRVIAGQIMRSGSSVGANYFEAKSASSKNDYANFFAYSLKSANETKFWLEILKEAGKVQAGSVDNLINEVCEISKILAKSIITLKRSGK